MPLVASEGFNFSALIGAVTRRKIFEAFLADYFFVRCRQETLNISPQPLIPRLPLYIPVTKLRPNDLNLNASMI